MKFNPSANPPAYVSPDENIEKGSRVRLKIVGTRTDVNEIYAIGSIKRLFGTKSYVIELRMYKICILILQLN